MTDVNLSSGCLNDPLNVRYLENLDFLLGEGNSSPFLGFTDSLMTPEANYCSPTPSNPVGGGFSTFTSLKLPISKGVKKELPELPTKDMELQMDSESFDKFIDEQVRLKGPLSMNQLEKVKIQRRRIKNREAAKVSRKKKNQKQSAILTENIRLKEENSSLKAEISTMSEELSLLKAKLKELEQLQQIQPPEFIQTQQQQQQQFQNRLQQFTRTDHDTEDFIQQQQQQQKNQQFFQTPLWRINSHTRPALVLTSFIFLFCFIFLLPYQQKNITNSFLNQASIIGENVDVNNNFDIKHVNHNFGRTLKMFEPSIDQNSTLSNSSDSNIHTDEFGTIFSDAMDDLTYILLLQSPEDIYNDEITMIDLLIPTFDPNHVLKLTTKVLEMQTLSSSQNYFPCALEAY